MILPACQGPRLVLRLREQRAMAGVLPGGLGLVRQCLALLLAAGCSTCAVCLERAGAPVAPCAIVLAALANRSPDAGTRLWVTLRGTFWGALLLPAGVAPRCLCGRATGLSATATPRPAHAVLPAHHGFFPGTWHTVCLLCKCAIFWTAQHTPDAASPHESPRGKTVRSARQ